MREADLVQYENSGSNEGEIMSVSNGDAKTTKE